MTDSKLLCMLGKPSGEVRSGELGLIGKGTLKKTKMFYAILSSVSQSGVARLELYDNVKHSLSLQPSLMLVGQDVIKVERVTMESKETRDAFLISTKDHHYTFFTRNVFDCETWVKDIQNTLLGRAHEGCSSKNINAVIQENEVYVPCDEIIPQIEEFTVTTDKATRTKMGVDGKVKIVVANGSITIISLHGKKIVEWAIKEIRRFGRTHNNFILVAGRRSTLGEGEFNFITEQGNSIMASINRYRNKKGIMDGQGNAPNSTVPWLHQVPPSTKMKPQAWNTESLYEPLEDILPPSHSTDSICTQKRPSVLPKNLFRSDSPGSPTKNEPPVTMPFPPSTRTSSVDQHTIRLPPKKETIHQEQSVIYSEPELIKEAWKSHGRNDEDTDSNLYSGLTYSQSHPTKEKEEDKNHYWDGSLLHHHEQHIEQEPLYAKIDPSKKKNK